MPIVYRKYPHLCITPLVASEPGAIPEPDGDVGDVWRCDDADCGRLWEVQRTVAYPGRMWWQATLVNRIRFRRRHRDVGVSIFEPPVAETPGSPPAYAVR